MAVTSLLVLMESKLLLLNRKIKLFLFSNLSLSLFRQLSDGFLSMSVQRMFATTPLIKLGDENFKNVRSPWFDSYCSHVDAVVEILGCGAVI